MELWIKEKLSEILDFQIPDDMISYILSINKEDDLIEYMKSLIDLSDTGHKKFIKELCNKRFPDKGSLPKQQKKKISKTNSQELVNIEKPFDKPANTNTQTVEKAKKKSKFVNLYSQEGKNAQVVLLKGRHRCDCQAYKHELINNCLQCGRVVCKQEGSGPCLFCGNLVCTPEEQKEINAKTKGGAKLMETLLERNRPKGWEEAVLHRNRMLEFDRTSECRNRVTDDDSDYFNVNSVWLSSSERERLRKYQQSLHEKKHASRLTKKMTFDFAGRQVLEDNTVDYEVDPDIINDITRAQQLNPKLLEDKVPVGIPDDRDVAPGVNAPILQFDPIVSKMYAPVTGGGLESQMGRVQDAELQEMSDSGRCLSMHQPWASLLIEGIKKHEGRTWYSSHRGRLWIASTAKPPEPTIVRDIENTYTVLNNGKQLKFPSFYPTGCLLGCVTVDDCLAQEEYRKKYPEGESDSPYVFICSNPIVLRLRFPIKGQHKIYTLDKTIHQAAIKCMMKFAKSSAIDTCAS